MDSIIKMVLDSNWNDLTKVVEQSAATKIKQKIADKKQQIIDRMNEGILDVDEISTDSGDDVIND